MRTQAASAKNPVPTGAPQREDPTVNMHWKVARPLVVAGIAITVSLILGCSGNDKENGKDSDDPVRVAAALTTTEDNLFGIGKALANYESAIGAFPLPAIRD